MRFLPLPIVALLAACSPTAPPLTHPSAEPVELLPPLSDPFEPVNRGVWAMNKGLLVGVVQPTGMVYRAAVPEPARRSVRNFSRNITYPGRLINHALQGRWDGAGDETVRFLTNTTVGAAGLFDVAGKWGIPRSNASFGQTFSKWGWKRGTYIMLPIAGPSDEVNATGYFADKAAEPWMYFPPPYRYGSAATGYNQLTETSDSRAQFVRAEADSYATTKYVWSYTDFEGEPDWNLVSPPDASTLQTLQVAKFRCQDPSFPHKGRDVAVHLPSTGKTFRATTWMQKKPAPVVYISPGLGSHRISGTPAVIAEFLYQNGYSVVTTSSIFHPEYMESASTSALTAYPPNDSRDLLAALTAVDRELSERFGDRISGRALLGLSMGGFQALYIAANQERYDPSFVHFDRYVAINAPLDLTHGIVALDRFYNAPMKWPASVRRERLLNTVHKVYAIADGKAPASLDAPFDGSESRFLIGLNFRFILRDAIFSTQSRHNLGIVKTPLHKWHRQPAYDEIMEFSYNDYFQKFVLPYYATRGVHPGDFKREASLKSRTAALSRASRIRVISNRDDFLLTPEDASWLRSTIPASRLHFFQNGGHLGNLTTPGVRTAILKSLDGLR
ncbi:MAG: MlaA family lipoprotein [Verrucomicrobiota bacterium]